MGPYETITKSTDLHSPDTSTGTPICPEACIESVVIEKDGVEGVRIENVRSRL